MNTLNDELKSLCLDLDVWAAAIMVPNESHDELVCVAHYNLPADWAALTNPMDDSTLNGLSFTNNEVVTVNGLNESTIRGTTTVHPFDGVMIVPVVKSNEVVATLELINDNPHQNFGETEKLKVQKVAAKLSQYF